MNSHQATVILTREIVQAAARHFMRRFIVRSSISDIVFVAIGITLGLTGIISRELAIGWTVAGLALIVLILVVALKYVRLAKAKFSSMTDPQITYTCTESTFGTKSCLGSMEVPWKTITQIWKFDDVWLLFFGSHGYSTLPVTLVNKDFASFVEERVKATGGKVS